MITFNQLKMLNKMSELQSSKSTPSFPYGVYHENGDNRIFVVSNYIAGYIVDDDFCECGAFFVDGDRLEYELKRHCKPNQLVPLILFDELCRCDDDCERIIGAALQAIDKGMESNVYNPSYLEVFAKSIKYFKLYVVYDGHCKWRLIDRQNIDKGRFVAAGVRMNTN